MAAEISVDRACQVGGILLLAGIVAAVGAVVVWGRAGWGDLNPSVIARPPPLPWSQPRSAFRRSWPGSSGGSSASVSKSPQMSAAEANRPALEV
jgi:hypothetical protein